MPQCRVFPGLLNRFNTRESSCENHAKFHPLPSLTKTAALRQYPKIGWVGYAKKRRVDLSAQWCFAAYNIDLPNFLL